MFTFAVLTAFKVLLEEVRCVVTKLCEVLVEERSTFDDMLRKDILLTIDPEVVKSFLSTVQDLR